MKFMRNLNSILCPLLTMVILLLGITSCETKEEKEPEKLREMVEMVTDKGTMRIALYNETPQHRDNFLKLASEGAYDSLLFHRVIENFMVQGGDPESKIAQAGDTLGNGDLAYTVPAEFHPELFHKKGALAAARTGNPERASSAMQFYLVQGNVLNDTLLEEAEVFINEWLAEYYVLHDPQNEELYQAIKKADSAENWREFRILQDSVINMGKTYTNFEKYSIPEAHQEVYKTLGGTAFLDQNYTVFGEVVEGMDVIDSIAKVQTGDMNR
ncbi:MAG: peptidylprolyl isomerase, partial [Muriicola sp.]|nr:peptidylprolyl isomerase [Muriicola sp.]